MTYVTTHLTHFPGFATPPGPSRFGAWLAALGQFLQRCVVSAPARRDVVREACEVRAWAEEIRGTDPRFADDLFAAADRHERSEY